LLRGVWCDVQSRGSEETTGKVKSKKGSKMYKAAAKPKQPTGPPGGVPPGKDDLR
jgi:hypothetical protein